MNQNTRQRLIGTLVLALAALILLPVIFDGEGSYQPVLQTDIPERPARPVAARSDPQRPVITADTEAIRLNDVPDTGASSADTLDAGASDARASDAQASPVVVTQSPATAADSQPQADPAPASAEQASPEQPATEQPAPAPAATAQVAAQAAGASPGLDNQGLPQGFSVRLGSFGNASNASNLVTRLQDAGHRAYTRQIDSSQGALTAVFVGPVVDRTTAATLLEDLRRDFQLNGMIVRYEIEEL